MQAFASPRCSQNPKGGSGRWVLFGEIKLHPPWKDEPSMLVGVRSP